MMQINSLILRSLGRWPLNFSLSLSKGPATWFSLGGPRVRISLPPAGSQERTCPLRPEPRSRFEMDHEILAVLSSHGVASIQMSTCTGWTAPIDGTPAAAHRARNSSAGAGVGPARVRVANIGCEEFQEAHAGALARGGNELRQSR